MKIKIKHTDTLIEIEEEGKYFSYPHDNAIVKTSKKHLRYKSKLLMEMLKLML